MTDDKRLPTVPDMQEALDHAAMNSNHRLQFPPYPLRPSPKPALTESEVVVKVAKEIYREQWADWQPNYELDLDDIRINPNAREMAINQARAVIATLRELGMIKE